jgi:hypothetical protein
MRESKTPLLKWQLERHVDWRCAVPNSVLRHRQLAMRVRAELDLRGILLETQTYNPSLVILLGGTVFKARLADVRNECSEAKARRSTKSSVFVESTSM